MNQFSTDSNRLKRTDANFRFCVTYDSAMKKKYAKLAEQEKLIYEKCYKLGINYYDHPKPGRNSYMFDVSMVETLVKTNPELYPYKVEDADLKKPLDHILVFNRWPKEDTNEIIFSHSWHSQILPDGKIDVVCRRFFQGRRKINDPSSKLHGMIDWVTVGEIYEDVWSVDTLAAIEHWSKELGIRLIPVRIGAKRSSHGYTKLADCKIDWGDSK
jgi:hypothetical protein